jgi:uncharacterized protein
MARPPGPRHVTSGLGAGVFKPVGTAFRDLEVVALDIDGLEALRLADLVGLYQEAAAEMMGVSRATFGRILGGARRQVSEALVDGKALRIGGGAIVEEEGMMIPCPVHGDGRRRGRGCCCPGRWAEPGAEAERHENGSRQLREGDDDHDQT